jgi:glycosyltransferase involved in cell wall biosynthesis
MCVAHWTDSSVQGPTFSVVIPVYNGAATIARAIESVLAQTFAPSQLIVVDDGSTDETARVVAKFGERVTYLYQANAGVSAARNNGAQRAMGEWLAFLDADDWYYPDRLRWHAEWIGRDPALDFLTGDYDYRRPDGSLISRSMEITEAGVALLGKAKGAREVIMELEEMEPFIENHFGDTHTLSVSKRTFMRLGGYPLGRAVCEDVNFLIRLCAASKRVGVICEPMGVYLIRPDSATRTDSLRSQYLTVEALRPLKRELQGAAPAIRRGLRGRLRRARLNLAYALLRRRKRIEAMGAVLTSLVENRSLAALRDTVSVSLGALQIPGR